MRCNLTRQHSSETNHAFLSKDAICIEMQFDKTAFVRNESCFFVKRCHLLWDAIWQDSIRQKRIMLFCQKMPFVMWCNLPRQHSSETNHAFLSKDAICYEMQFGKTAFVRNESCFFVKRCHLLSDAIWQDSISQKRIMLFCQKMPFVMRCNLTRQH